jgi:hypothetical protein
MPTVDKGARVSLDWKSATVVGTVEKSSNGWVYVRLDDPVEDRTLVACRESRVGAILVD